MATDTISKPPDIDIDRDPDYDELWELVFKLNTILTAAVAAGASTDEALVQGGADPADLDAFRFNGRERAVLAAVDRRNRSVGTPASV